MKRKRYPVVDPRIGREAITALRASGEQQCRSFLLPALGVRVAIIFDLLPDTQAALPPLADDYQLPHPDSPSE